MSDGKVFFMEFPQRLFFVKPEGGLEQREMPRVGQKERKAIVELIVQAVNKHLSGYSAE
jgi:hypothetical protein